MEKGETYKVTYHRTFHFFVYKPKRGFYNKNKVRKVQIDMHPARKHEGKLHGEFFSCSKTKFDAEGVYRVFPLGLRTITGEGGPGAVPEYPKFKMPFNFVGIKLFFGWEVYFSHTYNIQPTVCGKRKWGLGITLQRIKKKTIGANNGKN
jgi:hypothetical protein